MSFLIKAHDSSGLRLFFFASQEEQIKKDEQFARALQEQLKQGETTSPPETRGSELPSQSRDPQVSEEVRGGAFTKARLSCITRFQ